MQDLKQFDKYFPSNIVYGFLGKQPGIAPHRYRDHDNAPNNRNKVLKMLGSNHSSISVLKQVHGIACADIQSLENINYNCEGDAQITKNANIIIAVQTADCTPVLFVDPIEKIIGVAHAGWRGALDGIIASTLKEMKKHGALYRNIIAIIGPCIRQDSYEVSKDFLNPFLLANISNSKFFKKSQKNKEKYLFDLPGYVTGELRQSKIKNIYDTKIDTLTNPDFYSYRRACLAGKDLDGYNLSLIGLK
jgi:YfiH family protein